MALDTNLKPMRFAVSDIRLIGDVIGANQSTAMRKYFVIAVVYKLRIVHVVFHLLVDNLKHAISIRLDQCEFSDSHACGVKARLHRPGRRFDSCYSQTRKHGSTLRPEGS